MFQLLQSQGEMDANEANYLQLRKSVKEFSLVFDIQIY